MNCSNQLRLAIYFEFNGCPTDPFGGWFKGKPQFYANSTTGTYECFDYTQTYNMTFVPDKDQPNPKGGNGGYLQFTEQAVTIHNLGNCTDAPIRKYVFSPPVKEGAMHCIVPTDPISVTVARGCPRSTSSSIAVQASLLTTFLLLLI
jgi:hypothetical protein